MVSVIEMVERSTLKHPRSRDGGLLWLDGKHTVTIHVMYVFCHALMVVFPQLTKNRICIAMFKVLFKEILTNVSILTRYSYTGSCCPFKQIYKAWPSCDDLQFHPGNLWMRFGVLKLFHWKACLLSWFAIG